MEIHLLVYLESSLIWFILSLCSFVLGICFEKKAKQMLDKLSIGDGENECSVRDGERETRKGVR